ncbi:MAG: hypothetical protein NT023_12235 [Armatimonadetes bacterium]|nr:hypothetical protein [Armatimonadota bacterium]
MGQVINALLIGLILAGIFAVIRLIQIMKRLETTLESTQADVNKTLTQLNSVAASTQKLMEDELTPTLQVARKTLENVQETTRVLADVTQSAQRVTKKVEGMLDTSRLVASSMGAVKGLFGGLKSLVAGRKPAPQPAKKVVPPKEAETTPAPAKVLKSKQ